MDPPAALRRRDDEVDEQQWRVHAPHSHSDSNASSAAAQAAVASSPVSMLYCNALQSIFAFLTLRELNAACSVSLGWGASVRQMPSIGSFVELSRDGLLRVIPSSLSRHCTQVH